MGVTAMGMIFECDGQEIWSTSLGVGNLFLAQIRAIESLLGTKSGVDSFLADTVEIDASLFNSFIGNAMQTLESTNNAPLFALMAGCLEIAIALNTKITDQLPDTSEKLMPLLTKAKSVMYTISV